MTLILFSESRIKSYAANKSIRVNSKIYKCMGDINQMNFVKRNMAQIKPPIFEVGAKDYGSTQIFRDLFKDQVYVTADMEEGKNVDLVLDLTTDIDDIKNKLPVKSFNTIMCFSVLEHCNNPFKMAENLTELLADGGKIFIGVPFSWHIHAYPSDYWRFTPEGIKVLFPKLNFDLHQGETTTNLPNETKALNKNLCNINIRGFRDEIKNRRLGYLTAILLYVFKGLGIMKEIVKHDLLFPPTMITMIGVKEKRT